MQFILATVREVPEIAALVNSGYRGAASRAGWTTEADFFEGERTNAEALAKYLTEHERLMLLLREEGRLVGCVLLQPRYGGDEKCCYLGMLTVDPRAQARQLGRALMQAAEDKARELGAGAIELRVLSPREELMAWYERRGYRRTGRTEPFPYEHATAEKPVRTDMHFVLFRKEL